MDDSVRYTRLQWCVLDKLPRPLYVGCSSKIQTLCYMTQVLLIEVTVMERVSDY